MAFFRDPVSLVPRDARNYRFRRSRFERARQCHRSAFPLSVWTDGRHGSSSQAAGATSRPDLGKARGRRRAPFPSLGQDGASFKMTQFILTPKVGYRVLDKDAFKIDALAGMRYWYFGETL